MASFQGLGVEVAGPAHQPVRAQRLRWWLGGEDRDREVGMNDNVGETKKLIYCYTLYIIIQHYVIVITLYIIK